MSCSMSLVLSASLECFIIPVLEHQQIAPDPRKSPAASAAPSRIPAMRTAEGSLGRVHYQFRARPLQSGR